MQTGPLAISSLIRLDLNCQELIQKFCKIIGAKFIKKFEELSLNVGDFLDTKNIFFP